MKRLSISFRTSTGGSRTYYFRDPSDSITAEVAQALGNSMIGCVVPADWQLDRAAVIDTTTNELFDLIE